MKKRILSWALCLALLPGLLGGCAREESMDAAFQGEVEILEDIAVPVGLPEELCGNYNAWSRVETWAKMAQSGNGEASLYAESGDDSSLYLLWNGYFYRLPWADEREMEMDVDLYLEDLDGDGARELAAVSHARGSSGWGRDQVYLLEQGNGQLTQVRFPLEEFELWLEEHCAVKGGQVRFFSLSAEAAQDGALDGGAALILFTVDRGLSVSVRLAFQDGQTAAVLTGGLSYRDGAFSVSEPWAIRSSVQEEAKSLVFAWTEGYLASPAGEQRVFALTFYYQAWALPFALSDIVSITLDGVPEDAEMDLTWEPADIEEADGYMAYSVYCIYTPAQTGTFESKQVTFYLSDGNHLSYPFGHLYFDVGESDSGAVDTWESTAVFSSSAAFPYEFSPQGDAFLTRIQYAPDAAVEDSNGLDDTGRISLTEEYNAPLVLIMAKLWSGDGEGASVSYGKGCYCGAFDTPSTVLQRSLAHWAAA
ncbi:MAG: hypothetical protein LUD69_05015 [Oscillospiraceae bacterium]|nr:hypothetical protein [Oscillospiraceae bacterium]